MLFKEFVLSMNKQINSINSWNQQFCRVWVTLNLIHDTNLANLTNLIQIHYMDYMLIYITILLYRIEIQGIKIGL